MINGSPHGIPLLTHYIFLGMITEAKLLNFRESNMHLTKRFAQGMLAPMFLALLIGCSGSSDSGTETPPPPSPYAGKYNLTATSDKTGERPGLMVVETDGSIISVEFTGLTQVPLNGSVSSSGSFATESTEGKFFGDIKDFKQVIGTLVLTPIDPNLQISVTGLLN